MVTQNHPGSSSLRPSTLIIGFALIFLIWYSTLSSRSTITTATTTTYSKFITMTSNTNTNTNTGSGSGSVSGSTHHNIDISSSLNVSSRQTGTSPPRITFSVTNNSSRPLTILAWDTPLDPLALQLGRATVSVLTPGRTDEEQQPPQPLDLPIIQIRRKMPPGPEALVTIEPGATAENDVVLREALVPPEKLLEIAAAGARLSVACRGRWTTVWPGRAENVTEEMRKELSGGGTVLSGAYESEPLELKIDPVEL